MRPDSDGLDEFRGIVNAALLGIALWAIIILVVIYLTGG